MVPKLNITQWLVASVAVFIAMSIVEYVVHGMLLNRMYDDPAYFTLWRGTGGMNEFIIWFYLGYAMFALLFAFVYTRGYEGKPGIGEGLRYGLYMGLLIYLPNMFIDHALFPYPRQALIAWFASGAAECILFGLIVGLIYKGRVAATQ